MKTVDVDEVIEGAPVGALVTAVTLFLSLALFLDGMDFTMVGYLMPVLTKSFAASHNQVVLVLAVSPLGGSLGGFIGGSLGDRFGRRRLLFGSILLFGFGTLAIALAQSITVIAATRLVAAIGLGAATPNIAALLSEVLPRRLRALLISLAFAGFPLGASANGLLIPWILPAFGWRGVVMVGALAPLLLLIVMLRLVPESPSFLVSRPGRSGELARLLGRLRPDLSFSHSDQFTIPRPEMTSVGVSALMSRTFRRDTFSLWVVGFSNQFAAVSLSSWATTALTALGFAYVASVRGQMAGNLAGAAGAIFGGWMIRRYGSRTSLRLFAVLGVLVGAALFAWTSQNAGAAGPAVRDLILVIAMALIGISITGVQLGEYPLATHLYPAQFRVSGVGWAAAFGRIGAISATAATGLLVSGLGPQFLFVGVAAAIAVTWCALTLIRRHVERIGSVTLEPAGASSRSPVLPQGGS